MLLTIKKIILIATFSLVLVTGMGIYRIHQAQAAANSVYFGGFSYFMWYCNESENWWHLEFPFFYNNAAPVVTALTTSNPTGATRYANYFIHAGGWQIGQLSENKKTCDNYYGYYYFTLPSTYTFNEKEIGTSP